MFISYYSLFNCNGTIYIEKATEREKNYSDFYSQHSNRDECLVVLEATNGAYVFLDASGN